MTVDKDGTQSYTTAPSSMGFKIGLNPNPSEKNPEKFVVVRHIANGNTLLYLLDKDVEKTEKVANRNVIVPGSMVPEPVDSP